MYIILCIVCSVYKQLKINPVQCKDISWANFCLRGFCGKENDKNVLQNKAKNSIYLILSDLNEKETKFKQYYQEKRSNFIIALKLSNPHFDRKRHFKSVCIL